MTSRYILIDFCLNINCLFSRIRKVEAERDAALIELDRLKSVIRVLHKDSSIDKDSFKTCLGTSQFSSKGIRRNTSYTGSSSSLGSKSRQTPEYVFDCSFRFILISEMLFKYYPLTFADQCGNVGHPVLSALPATTLSIGQCFHARVPNPRFDHSVHKLRRCPTIAVNPEADVQ